MTLLPAAPFSERECEHGRHFRAQSLLACSANAAASSAHGEASRLRGKFANNSERVCPIRFTQLRPAPMRAEQNSDSQTGAAAARCSYKPFRVQLMNPRTGITQREDGDDGGRGGMEEAALNQNPRGKLLCRRAAGVCLAPPSFRPDLPARFYFYSLSSPRAAAGASQGQ